MAAPEPRESFLLRTARRLVRAASRLAPIEHRAVLRETWLGELYHRSQELKRDGRLESRAAWDLFVRSTGSVGHAIWTRRSDWSLDVLFYELYHAARQWLQRPMLALIAVATLAAGIGANTYIFGVVDGMLLRPFPYPDSEQLVTVGVSFPRQSSRVEFIEAVSVQDYLELAGSSERLSKFLAFDMGNRDLGGVERPERLLTGAFWGNPFSTLGMPALLGRGFTEEEIAAQAPVAIISFRVWQRLFEGSEGVLSQSITINGTPRSIVGVMPRRLLLFDTDLWLPMWYTADDLPRSRRPLTVLARLDTNLEAANAELDTLAARIEADNVGEHPQYQGWTLRASPLTDVWASFVGPAGTILLIAMGAVLLIVCANLAAVMLARASGRRREMAIRSAMGASGYRLAQQLLFETGWLALSGGALGLGLAAVALKATMAYLPEDAPLGAIELAVNSHVIWYNLAVSLLGALVFGAAPALEAARTKAQTQLRSERGSTGTRSGLLFRRALVVGQIALSLVLMCGASLLVMSEHRLSRVEPGIALDGVMSFRVTLPWERYSGRMQESFLRIAERLEEQVDVARAAVATEVPPQVRDNDSFRVETRPADGDETLPRAAHTIISPSWFQTMDIPLASGRLFSDSDHAEAPRVAVINRAFASRYFGDDPSPLGQRLRLGREEDSPWATIVGVVADSRNQGLDREPAPQIFSSYSQAGQFANQAFVLVRGNDTDDDSNAEHLLSVARETLRGIDPNLPIYLVKTMNGRFSEDLANRRILSATIGALAICSVLLAVMGLYGVVAFIGNQHRHEFGIRVAMGARRSDLIRWMMIRSGWMVSGGLVLGIGLALLAGRGLELFLFQVQSSDPTILSGAAVLVGAVALLASYLPARRAARRDPMESLRS